MGKKGLKHMNRKTPLFLFVFLCLMSSISFAWLGTYANRFPINCLGMDNGQMVKVNGSNGFTLNGSAQYVWTSCSATTPIYLYYDNATSYAVGNDTAALNMEVESGNVSSVNAIALWQAANAVGVWHVKAGENATVTDSLNYNNKTPSGAAAYTNYDPAIAHYIIQQTDANQLYGTANPAIKLPEGTGAATYMGWVNYGSGTTSYSQGACSGAGKWRSLNFGATYVLSGCGSDWNTGISTSAGNWVHTAMVWNGSTQRGFFANGNGLFSSQGATSLDTSKGFREGNDAAGGNVVGKYYDLIIYNESKTGNFINNTYKNYLGTSSYGTLNASEAKPAAPSANINVTLNSPANGYTSTNANVVLDYSINFTGYSNVTAVLYINGTAYSNNTTTTNQTFTFPFAANYLSYSWYVFAYNTSSIAQNTTSATNTFSIYYLLNATQKNPTNGTTQQNKTVFFVYDSNSTLPSNITATLYLNGVQIATNTSASNTTYNNSYATTFGVHSWYVKVQDANNASRVNTTGNFTFEINFAVSAVSPASGTALSGNVVNLIYATSNLHPINCTTYIDGVAVNNQMVASSSTISTAQTVANGSHYWQTNCAGDDAPTYFQNTTNRTFTINFFAFNTQANLTTSPENVFASPQAMFFDINGDLNVLYFTDEGTSQTARIKTISGSTVTASANLTLAPTAQFFVAFRNPTNTTILTRNATDSTKGILLTLAGNVLTQTNYTLPSINALNLTVFDAYTYANTKAFPTLAPTASSFWLFTTPLATGSNVTKWNGTGFSVLRTFVNSVSGQWQTIANDSSLTTWLYAVPFDASGNEIHIFSYNGTNETDVATLDGNKYTAAQLSAAIVGFEKYGNKTYAYATNISNRTTFLLIEENKTFQINTSITNPSHILFIDQYTFVFFATSGGDTFAYSCYFGATPNCDRLASSEYGLAVPYEQGFMSSAKRDTLNQDTVVRGLIQSGSVVQLNYNINTYDMKFICYDEQTDLRKTFKQRTVTDTTSNALLNYSWGYVLPRASIGAGLMKYYSTCLNGTQRLFLSGLTANFSIDEYSLLSTAGVYYSFTIKDRYGSPIQDVKTSMLRFSNAKQAFVVIEQCISDFNGGCVFFLEPYNSYKILIEASGYATQYVDFIPSSITSINVALDASGTSFSLPNYNYIFGDLTTSLSPTSTLMNNATNITFTVVSNASELEYYGMNVFRTINGTRTLVYSNNISTQPSGGTIPYLVNATGRYDVQVYAKHQNFSIYEPFTTAYNFQGKSGLVKARDTLTGSTEISGWGLYFLGVIITMVVVGFVSRYTIDGAGIVGVLILWGFTLLDPTGVLYTAGAVVITTTIATTITTIAAFGALYLRYSATTGG